MVPYVAIQPAKLQERRRGYLTVQGVELLSESHRSDQGSSRHQLNGMDVQILCMSTNRFILWLQPDSLRRSPESRLSEEGVEIPQSWSSFCSDLRRNTNI